MDDIEQVTFNGSGHVDVGESESGVLVAVVVFEVQNV